MTPTSDDTSLFDKAAQPFDVAEQLPQHFPDVQPSAFRAADNTLTYIVPIAQVLDVMLYLRDEGGYLMLEDVTAVDWSPRSPRFDIVYNLIALFRSEPLRLKVMTDSATGVPSMTGLWPSANWYEREIFDLFGVLFADHPDLRRIEMPDDWEGHPLRKDYPITGPRRPNLPAVVQVNRPAFGGTNKRNLPMAE